jgi:DNA replication and repair protein RecF
MGLPRKYKQENMKLLRLRLVDFRNHPESCIEFGSGINAIVGMNGQGKTNVLEAISYISLTKSFFTAPDATVARIGTDGFELMAELVGDTGVAHQVRVTYARSSGEKEVVINRLPPESMRSVIGRFPLVVLSPEHHAITTGGPAERRRFIDLLLSQISQSYLADLVEYRRIVRQRNHILALGRNGGVVRTEDIEPWTESLVQQGVRIMRKRSEFVAGFSPYMKQAYEQIAGVDESPSMEYIPSVSMNEGESDEELSHAFGSMLQMRVGDELRRGITLVGPHRDDLRFTLNKLPVQTYASQGQHKTMLVGLKVAEFRYLNDHRDERPVFLMDDVFGELDAHRAQHILSMVHSLGQAIITATDESVFHGSMEWSIDNRRIYVKNGSCSPIAA